jgi:hypothetical protein
VLTLCALLIAGAVIACGGDDDGGDDEGTPTSTPTASRVTRSPTPTGDDGKTPEPEESPDGGESPDGTETPAVSPAAEGTPAVAPPNQIEFLQQFAGRSIDEEGCTYNPATRITDCGGRGRFAVDPPPAGEDVSCIIAIVDGRPEYIRCESQNPLQAIYYDVP